MPRRNAVVELSSPNAPVQAAHGSTRNWPPAFRRIGLTLRKRAVSVPEDFSSNSRSFQSGNCPAFACNPRDFNSRPV